MERKWVPVVKEFYLVEVNGSEPHSKKSFKIVGSDGRKYFFKKTNVNANEKYMFLSNHGIFNVLYPVLNKDRQFVTKKDNEAYYLSDFVDSYSLIDEVKAHTMYQELRNLHKSTTYKRQLSPSTARPKFEEITAQLDYKFRLMEEFIRSVENKPMGIYTMPILSNYHHFLNAKREMVTLQKKIISAIKDRETVQYAFVHNNPKLDHFLIHQGSKYLTSIENGKVGLSSLDMAKFYLENEHLNIDFRATINDFRDDKDFNNEFYYDYFRFLVLYVYVKRVNIQGINHISAQSMINHANSIQRYFEQFHNITNENEEEEDT